MTGWIIAGCVLAALALLLCIPVRVRAEYDGEFSASLRYAFLRFSLYPAKPKKKKAGKKKAKEKDKKKKPEKEQSLADKLKKLKKDAEMVLDLLRSAKGPLRFLFDGIRIRLLELRIVVAGEDAHKTGDTYGKICAAAYPLIFELRKIKKPAKQIIGIRPEFCSSQGSILARTELALTPWTAVAAVIGIAFNYIGRAAGRKMGKTRVSAVGAASAAARRI